MEFRSLVPQRLSKSVEAMIYFRGFDPPSPWERLVPAPGLFLVLELDGMVRHIVNDRDHSVFQVVSGSWVSGLQKCYRTISAHPGSEMLAVQFRPFGASALVPGRLSDYENRIVPALEVFGQDMAGLRDSLVGPGSPESKLSRMEAWLEARATPIPPEVRGLEDVIAQLRGDPDADVASAVRTYPRSHRQLVADFRRHVGTTPKFLQRILRFQSLLNSLENAKSIQWSDLAYRWGYSDQSHLVREFRAFSGFVPTEFLHREFHRDGTNFFPLVKNRQDGEERVR